MHWLPHSFIIIILLFAHPPQWISYEWHAHELNAWLTLFHGNRSKTGSLVWFRFPKALLAWRHTCNIHKNHADPKDSHRTTHFYHVVFRYSQEREARERGSAALTHWPRPGHPSPLAMRCRGGSPTSSQGQACARHPHYSYLSKFHVFQNLSVFYPFTHLLGL